MAQQHLVVGQPLRDQPRVAQERAEHVGHARPVRCTGEEAGDARVADVGAQRCGLLVAERGDRQGGDARLVVGGLALSGAGKLDLADNDLIVRATAATRDAVLADVTAKIMKSPGITSSAALADSSGLTTLGVLLNRNRLGQPLLNTFAGEVVDSDTVLVKYTYFGDANLSGDVDGTDYAWAHASAPALT